MCCCSQTIHKVEPPEARNTDAHISWWQLQHPRFVCEVEKLDVVDLLFQQWETASHNIKIFYLTEKLDVTGCFLKAVTVQEYLRLINVSRILQSWE